MIRIQRKKVTFEILTKAEDPLDLDNMELAALSVALEQAVKEHVNLRYYPDGNDFGDDYHELLGVGIVETTA